MISQGTQPVYTSARSHPEFAKQVIFTDDVIEFVKHIFMNEEWDKDAKEWVRKKDHADRNLDPMMKEDYINDLMSMLRLCLTRFMAMSKMERHEINNMILITANNIDIWFLMNWKKAGITREVYYSDILSDSLINLLEAIMKMPQDGSIQDFFKDTYRGSENLGADPNAGNRRPLISLPTFFNRGGQQQ